MKVIKKAWLPPEHATLELQPESDEDKSLFEELRSIFGKAKSSEALAVYVTEIR